MFKAAAVFSDNMVLQRGKNISVWGTADNDAVIIAELNGAKAECSAKDGKWSLLLPPMQAGGPFEMKLSVQGASEICTFRNVMIGEVWLCGGQSNMELELQNAKDGKEELAALNADIPVRFYYTNKVGTVEDAENAEKTAGWGVCDPEGSKAWSAVGYHFARKLAKELGVTVGLVGCNWGGTSASAWVDRKTLENNLEIKSYIDEYDKAIEGKSTEQQKREYAEYLEYDKKWNELSQQEYKENPTIGWNELQEKIGKNMWPGPINCVNPFRPAGLFETMLMRVCPYTMQGFLYYQGESDDHKPDTYYTLLTNLIRLWREKWDDDEMAFIMVQLPGFKFANEPDYKHWCKIRAAQMRAYKTIKNTGIAVALDCGEFNNIHPTDKKPVGERLCLQAQKLVYGMDVEAFGPMYKAFEYKNGGIEISFDYADNGFTLKGEKATGFEIAGEDGNYVACSAQIQGNKIFLAADEIEKPCYARYGWFNYFDVTVFGKNGIPLAPFRTSEYDGK